MEIKGRTIGVRIIGQGVKTKLMQFPDMDLLFHPTHPVAVLQLQDYEIVEKHVEELEALLAKAFPDMNHAETCAMTTRVHNPECTCAVAEVRTVLRHVDKPSDDKDRA